MVKILVEMGIFHNDLQGSSIDILQLPPVMYMLFVSGASGCQGICKFNARTEDHL